MDIIAYKVYYNQGEDHGIILLNSDIKRLSKEEFEESINFACLNKYDSEVYKYKEIDPYTAMLKDLTLGELKIYLRYFMKC